MYKLSSDDGRTDRTCSVTDKARIAIPPRNDITAAGIEARVAECALQRTSRAICVPTKVQAAPYTQSKSEFLLRPADPSSILHDESLTAFAARKGVWTVLILHPTSWEIRKGVSKSKMVEGPIERMACSKRSVKSKLSRQASTAGPKRSSLAGRHVEFEAIATGRIDLV
jgi:hypothetical protein